MLLIGLDATADSPARAAPLPPPEALAPVSASPEALVVRGGWQIDGLPDIVLRAGPAGRGADGRVFHRPDSQPAHAARRTLRP